MSKGTGMIKLVEVLNERMADTHDWTKLNQHFLRKDSWVVYSAGDTFSHYVSLVANLTGNIKDASEPTFGFVRATVREGLPRGAFDRIKGAIGTSSEELALVTDIPARTIARRKKFKPAESERLLRVGSAFQKTLELFEDLDRARKWFTTPKSALGGLSPIKCCDTETGCKEVENLLGRLDEGVYS
jgi:putative toxin-antitoxin system antitoxin component (TIGR02293 family)